MGYSTISDIRESDDYARLEREITETEKRLARKNIERIHMVSRMFHPVNGRFNFRDLVHGDDDGDTNNPENASYYVKKLADSHIRPSPETMIAMLQTEERLRLNPDTQRKYADRSINSIELTTQIQIQVVREFGYDDSYVRLLRSAAHDYSREEIPFDMLPHYVRFNRSSQGHLHVGDVAPNVPLCYLGYRSSNQMLSTWLDQLLSVVPSSKPIVLAAGSFT